MAVRSATARANGLQFGVLEAGSGPLALCLHGFPDAAHTRPVRDAERLLAPWVS